MGGVSFSATWGIGRSFPQYSIRAMTLSLCNDMCHNLPLFFLKASILGLPVDRSTIMVVAIVLDSPSALRIEKVRVELDRLTFISYVMYNEQYIDARFNGSASHLRTRSYFLAFLKPPAFCPLPSPFFVPTLAHFASSCRA